MIRVGITGGIGSGKSLVCRIFSLLNVPVYHADEEAHALSDHDPGIRKNLTSLFGEEIYLGVELNRIRMSELIFNDIDLLGKVNKIIHPVVARHFQEWCTKHINHPFIIQESAILFESGAHRSFDKIVTVTAPEEIRVGRILSRWNMTHEKARAIIRNQLPESELVRGSDFIIVNDDLQPVIPQVLKLYDIFHGFDPACRMAGAKD